jgi:hypothetical protein
VTSPVTIPIRDLGFQEVRLMSQRRLRLVFSNSKRVSKLPSGKFTMLRANLLRSQRVAHKTERLAMRRPDLADAVEKVVDRLLEEVG